MDPNEPKNQAQQGSVGSGVSSQSQGSSQLAGDVPTGSTISSSLVDNSTPPDETPASPSGSQVSMQTSTPTTTQVEEEGVKGAVTDQGNLVSSEGTPDEMPAEGEEPAGGGSGSTGTL